MTQGFDANLAGGARPWLPARRDLIRHLARRERQVAERVGWIGEASAEEVRAALPDPLSNAAVRSMLRRLVAKGLLARCKLGRKFLYRLA